MSKKKSNKNSLCLLSFIKYGAILFSIVGLVMTAFTFIKFEKLANFSGLQQIFGHSEDTTIGETVINTSKILSFSFLTLLAVILPLIGSISVLFKNKLVRLFGAIIMIAGCVLTFLSPNFIVFANETIQYLYSAINGSIGIGAILAGVFFGVGSLCSLYSLIEK